MSLIGFFSERTSPIDWAKIYRSQSIWNIFFNNKQQLVTHGKPDLCVDSEARCSIKRFDMLTAFEKPVQKNETELPLEIFPRWQRQYHRNPDMGDHDCLSVLESDASQVNELIGILEHRDSNQGDAWCIYRHHHPAELSETRLDPTWTVKSKVVDKSKNTDK